MLPIIRLPMFAASLVLLSACQMETTQLVENFEAEKIARTMGIVESCRASECARLNLDSGDLADYSIVADMTHVTAFMTSYTDFDDLSDIAGMTQLRELHMGSTRVSDLSGLSNFPNLTLLHAQNLRNVSDYSAIGQLSGLTELALGHSDLGDIAFLRRLVNLKSLSLEGATITNLNVLADMRSLQTLDLSYATVPDDIFVLLDIPNLTSLTWQYTSISSDQQAVLDRLKAQGVSVTAEQIIIVC